jgi:hypothetical protein
MRLRFCLNKSVGFAFAKSKGKASYGFALGL